MNPKEKQMAAYLLDKARDEFANHECNDVDDEIYEGWSLEERRALVKEYHAYNGDPEEYNPDFLHLPDYSLMSLLSHKLEVDSEFENSELEEVVNQLRKIKRQIYHNNSPLTGITLLNELILKLDTKILKTI